MVCSPRAGMVNSSAPWILKFCHSSLTEAMSSVSLAEPFQAMAPACRRTASICTPATPRPSLATSDAVFTVFLTASDSANSLAAL